MKIETSRLARLEHGVHARFLPLLIGSYLLAAWLPGWGLAIREASLGEVQIFGSTLRFGVPMVLLSCLLLNAGLGVEWAKLRGLSRAPGLLLAGVGANLVLPILFILGATRLMTGWHNADEVQEILVGLALVASMPIAGSSTAWAQNADGDLGLSLGLILVSTLVSPITTPLALHSIGLMATGDYATDLHELAAVGTGGFLVLCVLAPSLLGIGLRGAVGGERYAAAKPALKLVNTAVLLVLNYANASVSLPRAWAEPDADFLAITLAVVAGLCALGFAGGWAIGRALGAPHSGRTSLMFGLGMNNNGTGLVLASMALADHPRVMLPIIAYNLVQHLAAGVVDRLVQGPGARGARPIGAIPLGGRLAFGPGDAR